MEEQRGSGNLRILVWKRDLCEVRKFCQTQNLSKKITLQKNEQQKEPMEKHHSTLQGKGE